MLITISTYAYIAVSLAAYVLLLTNRIHMFQLSAYKYTFMLGWIKNRLAFLAATAILPTSSLAIALLPFEFSIAVAIAPNLVLLLLSLPKKAKKPLVFTTRVKRLYATSLLLFAILCLLSLALDGIFICQLALIAPSWVMLFANLINRPLENAVRRHYINQAKQKIASLPRLIVIGITGSYGKTGTKFILEQLLSEKYNVLMTPASYNTTMGVVKVVREQLTAAHDIFICEMGARGVGEIKEICDIVKPKLGIITSIGPCHLETFGSIENIIKTKFELCAALPEDGVIFLNADNRYIAEKADIAKKAIYYGLDNVQKSDYTASIASVSENGTRFLVNEPCGSSFELQTSTLARHSVLNVLGCVAVAKHLGVDNQSIILGAKRVTSPPHRLSLIKGVGFTILDDSFNSNPDGAKAALDVLGGFDGQKIIITPGMIELGEQQEHQNRLLGKYAAEICDYIFLVGKKQTEPIYSGAVEGGFDKERILIFEKVEEAISVAKALPCAGKNIILIENDLPDNF